MTRMYFDACCFNRPFDDQSQERIRLESEAILFLFEQHREGRIRIVTSRAVADEL